MEKIKITYIDDNPDTALSWYLDSEYRIENYNVEFKEVIFDSESGYENLIKNNDILTANIIFIDSRLFENKTKGSRRFTGEEFKVIFRKKNPFIEIFVITQNEFEEGYTTIKKYSNKSLKNGETAEEYYKRIIPPIIEIAVKNIIETRKILKKIEDNSNWKDKIEVEKLLNLQHGISVYEDLTKDDITKIIELFEKIDERLDEKKIDERL